MDKLHKGLVAIIIFLFLLLIGVAGSSSTPSDTVQTTTKTETTTTTITQGVAGESKTVTVTAAAAPAESKTVTVTSMQTVTSTTSIMPKTKQSDLTIQGLSQHMDILGFIHVNGEVVNNGTAIAHYVEVYYTIYDTDNKVLDSGSVYTRPTDVSPGDVAPFEVTIADDTVVAKFDHYKLTVSFKA